MFFRYVCFPHASLPHISAPVFSSCCLVSPPASFLLVSYHIMSRMEMRFGYRSICGYESGAGQGQQVIPEIMLAQCATSENTRTPHMALLFRLAESTLHDSRFFISITGRVARCRPQLHPQQCYVHPFHVIFLLTTCHSMLSPCFIFVFIDFIPLFHVFPYQALFRCRYVPPLLS